MPRARLLKPGFFKNEELASLRLESGAVLLRGIEGSARRCWLVWHAISVWSFDQTDASGSGAGNACDGAQC